MSEGIIFTAKAIMSNVRDTLKSGDYAPITKSNNGNTNNTQPVRDTSGAAALLIGVLILITLVFGITVVYLWLRSRRNRQSVLDYQDGVKVKFADLKKKMQSNQLNIRSDYNNKLAALSTELTISTGLYKDSTGVDWEESQDKLQRLDTAIDNLDEKVDEDIRLAARVKKDLPTMLDDMSEKIKDAETKIGADNKSATADEYLRKARQSYEDARNQYDRRDDSTNLIMLYLMMSSFNTDIRHAHDHYDSGFSNEHHHDSYVQPNYSTHDSGSGHETHVNRPSDEGDGSGDSFSGSGGFGGSSDSGDSGGSSTVELDDDSSSGSSGDSSFGGSGGGFGSTSSSDSFGGGGGSFGGDSSSGGGGSSSVDLS